MIVAPLTPPRKCVFKIERDITASSDTAQYLAVAVIVHPLEDGQVKADHVDYILIGVDDGVTYTSWSGALEFLDRE